jgi:alpha-tubulin suppressor-like RCC1 family protein
MYPGLGKKRKQENDENREPDGRSALSPVLRRPSIEAARPAVSNRYYKDNCASLFRQHVEALNEEHTEFIEANPNTDLFWQTCEYIREINQFKDLYQKPFTGFVLTCGSNEMNVLGYESFDNVLRPKRVMALTVGVVQISCGSAHTVVLDANGRVFAFGSSDEGAMGRPGGDYTGDLQVKGFIPSKHAKNSTPVENEDDCIIKVVCGTIQTLCLSIHGNLYEMGCFRDYEDRKLRDPKPPDDVTVDPQGKKFPFGVLWRPTHLYQIPGKVKDMASGTHMNVAILEDGTVVTWGVGTTGELARPVPDQFSDKITGHYDTDILREHFLKPLPVPFPMNKKLAVISVACGVGHLMVVAREPGAIESTVYGSGLNGDGQLGLGDLVSRKALTPVSMTVSTYIHV